LHFFNAWRHFCSFQVPNLSNPFRPNTVSTVHLLIVSLASPFFVIVMCEAIVFMSSEGTNKLRKFFHSATSIYLEYLASYTVTTFAMEAMKCAFARLRPHYLSANCTGTDMHRIRVGRQSFPSGHSAAAALLFTFLYFYLKGLTDATGSKLLRVIRAVLLSVVGMWAALVMTTRVTDHWHHPSDVLGGILLAAACIYIPVRRTHSSLVFKKRMLNNAHSA
uniref:AcidPPc domain-containing protein n=1 Tax=Gongylonema pulchrum TaxID=637853 RepID=A0A183E249_9BILA